MNPSHHCQQHLKGLLNSWATAFYKLAQQSMTENLKYRLKIHKGGLQYLKTLFRQMVTMIESMLTIINDIRLLVTLSDQSRTVTLTFGMIHGWK